MLAKHRDVVTLLTAANDLRAAGRLALATPAVAKQSVARAFTTARDGVVAERLRDIEIDRLAELTSGRVRIDALKAAGIRVVADVVGAHPATLVAVPGVGSQTATQVVAAARQLAMTIRDTTTFRFDAKRRPRAHAELLAAVLLHEDAERYASALAEPMRWLEGELDALLPIADLARSRLKMVVAGKARREASRAAVERLGHLLASPHVVGLRGYVADVNGWLSAPRRSPAGLWTEFDRRSADIYSRLAEYADLHLDIDAARGFLPADIAAAVSAQELDTSLLRVSLRGYQTFGAKFALVQRRCVLGDEMGLGKTVEALAAMAHLASVGASHFLVVCPASVLINWEREVAGHTHLRPVTVHGDERAHANRSWVERGGVAITTFDTLRHVTAPDGITPGLLVVDEAHNVKNPDTLRATHVRSWSDSVERVLFLTGTPLENRVEEFRTLVAYLQPDVARELSAADSLAGAEIFRRKVSRAYLRRNQDDVLRELPELIENDEWVALTHDDSVAYRDAVTSGNFMAMRRAAYVAPPGRSAKLARIRDIVEEATDDGLKVVVFSFFRDVLRAVGECLEGRVHGPLHGGVPPRQRQELVDAFTRDDRPAVLISQIQAGGTGLNMQAGSVVILTEPQFKPSLEAQAIARCHRMGQTRRVQVHRMLAEPGVDVRLLEILGHKAQLFDAYVRDSALAAATPDAMDVSETEIARQIVEEERRRLGVDVAAPDLAEEDDEWITEDTAAAHEA